MADPTTTTNTTNARFKSKKQVTIQTEDDDQLAEMSDDIPMSQQSITSSDAGYVYSSVTYFLLGKRL
jgi:hypothetical protein